MKHLETPQYFRVFVFNNQGDIMMVQKNNRLDLPNGHLMNEHETLETAARRVVFKETKTALDPIAPVTTTKMRNRTNQEDVLTAILVARTNGEAQIKPDDKTWHRYMSEVTFLLHPGYRNKLIKKLYEAARQTLVCEEIRIDREEETQYGTEKYNFKSLL